MAETEDVNIDLASQESLINRWLVDYYMSLAIELFKKEEEEDFRRVRDVIDSLLPCTQMDSDSMQTKILLLSFLSRINEGERLEVSFDNDESVSPLESAVTVLENMRQSQTLSPSDYDTVCTSLKEMLVLILIKNDQFEEAAEILKKHFPKPMTGRKAIFHRLISKKSKTHDVIDQLDFKTFKQEMLIFCQKLCPTSAPFLLRTAQDWRKKMSNKFSNENLVLLISEEEEAGPSSSPIVPFTPCKQRPMQRSRLSAVFSSLSQRRLSELEQEVETEGDGCLALRLSPSPIDTQERRSPVNTHDGQDVNSVSPMEASPAEEPEQTHAHAHAGSLSKSAPGPKTRRVYTVARLVVEPDSQQTQPSATSSQEAQQPPSAAVVSEAEDEPETQSLVPHSEVIKPTRKRRRQANNNTRASTSRGQIASDSEEDDPHTNRETRVNLENQSSGSPNRSQSSSNSEGEWFCVVPVKKTPVKKTPGQSPIKDRGDAADLVIDDSSDSSPQKSSTPNRNQRPTHSKWNHLMRNATETKETWSDEETHTTSRQSSRVSHSESPMSHSGKKRQWTDSETEKLKEGVKKFGEGNWCKIKSFYEFQRTNINLKDRWRTLKKLNMV